jgi:hypothetical protein
MVSRISRKTLFLSIITLGLTLAIAGVSFAKELTKEELGAIVVIILGGTDYETDSDGDGIPDIEDAFPNNPKENKDSDRDGVGDNSDVFPFDPSKSNAVVVNFSSGNVSSIVLNTDAASLGSNNARFGRAENKEGEGENNNIIAYDENGNEVDNAVETSDILFVAESVLSPDGESLYLLTSPHLQRALNTPPEVCSLYRVKLATEAVDCLVNDAGDVRPKVLNEYAVFSGARKGIDFRADGAAVLFGLNSDRNLPDGISGGTQNGYSWLLSLNGKLTGIEPSENFFIWDALWLDDKYIALYEHRYFELDGLDGNERQIRLIEAETLQDAPDSPVGFDFSASFARSPVGLMLAGSVILKSDLTLSERDGEQKLIEDMNGNFFGRSNGYLRQISANGLSYTGVQLEDREPGAYGANWFKQSGTGTDIKYSQVSSDENFLAYSKGFLPRTPIISVEGQLWESANPLEIAYAGGAVSINFGNSADNEFWSVVVSSTVSEDITVSYQVSLSESLTESRSLVIPASAINTWLASDEKPRCINSNVDSCLNWVTPEPHEEGFCLHKYGTDPSLDSCIQFNQSDNTQLSYKVLRVDMESLRQTRFDDAEVYPGGTENAFPGVQTLALIDGRLQAYFKDTRDHQYYVAVADADSFWTIGDSALLFAPAQNASGDNVIITEATSLTPLPPLPLSGVSVTAKQDGDAILVSIELPFITETQGYEFNVFADTPAATVSPLNGNNELAPTAGPTITAANILTVEYSSADFVSGEVYIAELPEHFMVNGSIRRRTPATQLLFNAPVIPEG